MASEERHSKKTSKVIQLTDEMKNTKPQKQKPKGEPGIPGLSVVGTIKEKGFSDESKANISFPQPRVTPFPKARHRSEGPHWAPSNSEPTETVEDIKDAEDVGVESLAAHACPLERKTKNTIDFSNWKEKLKMEKFPSKKLAESKKMNKPPVTSLTEGKEQESRQAHNEIKDVKALAVEHSPESSALKLIVNEQMRGELSVGIAREPGESVQITKEDNASEDARFSVCKQSDDAIVRHIDSLKISTRLDTTKEISKGHAEKVHDYGTEREVLRPKVDIQEIDAENRAALQAMSANEIEETQTELLGRLRPEIVEMLKKRGAEKVKKGNKGAAESNKDKEFGAEDGKTNLNNNQNDGFTSKKSHIQASFSTTRKESNELGEISSVDSLSNEWKAWSDKVASVRTMRFSLDGSMVEIEETATETKSSSQIGDNSDIYHFDVHNVAERDILRMEGDPASAGYTIKEAVALVRSVVPGQRAIALNLIAAVLDKALVNLHVNKVQSDASLDMHGRNKSVDWQAIWAYALGPEPELVLTLRMALDDSHSTVVVACAKVLQRLLSCLENESYFNLFETFWAGEKSIFAAPIFRKRLKLQEGFLGGGFWKYSAKPSNMFPFSNKNVEDGEVEATIGDDTSVAGQDAAAGLIRMGVLPRIRYILEVDQLAAAEEPLLSVITSLARHSPTAADAVMKCPRLIDTIIQRYINQRPDIKVDPIQVKAVHLLKVLCEANRSNCVHLLASGVFQSAARHLFCHYNLDEWLNMGEESFRSACAILVEELRLWKVCIEYGLSISCFSDFYPALCFWLNTPSFNIIIDKNIVSEVLSVARESFIVLEALARTLPNLHAYGHGENEGTDATVYENWSWSEAVPMVEVALKWLNFRENTFLSTTCKSDNHATKYVEHNSYRISSLGVMSAVLHLLSGIIEKIVPSEGAGYYSSNKEQPSRKWLPVFFPQVGLEIIQCRLLHFPEMKLEERVTSNMENSSLLKYLCLLRKESDHDTSLSAVSCIHGVIRLITSVDKAINIAQSDDPGITCMDKNISKCDKILKMGLIISCQDELKYTLDMFMDLVASEWHYVQCSEVKGRGGPAPGVGLGWGASNGGFWSRKVILAQADARVTVSLLDLFPVVLDNVVLDSVKLNFQKINAALSIVLITGPKDMLYLEKALTILFTVPVMEFLNIFVNKVLREKTIENASANIRVFHQMDFETFSNLLLVHFKKQWLRTKEKKSKRGGAKIETKNSTGNRNSYKKSPLGTICEESAELGSTSANENMALGIEWAHQRLPVPVQWLLSPLSTSIYKPEDVPLDGVIEKEKVFNNVRSGLFFLIGLEAMFCCNSFWFSLVSCIPLIRKIHALSMVFILDGDVFLEPSVSDLVGTLQGLYGEALDKDGEAYHTPKAQRSTNETLLIAEEYKHPMVDKKDSGRSTESGTYSSLNFQRDIDDSYQTFMEAFVEHFGATSYGDVVYGRQVAIYLRRDVETPIRLTTWNALASAHILELLPSLEECCGHSKGYLSPPEEHEKMIEAYVSSWVSGNLDKAAARMAVTFSLALHHVTAFLFIGDDGAENLQLRKKLARSLILDSSRKPHHQARMLHLLEYNFLDHFQEHGDLKNGPAVSMEEISRRFKFLSEACEGDSLLLAEVRNIQAAVPVK